MELTRTLKRAAALTVAVSALAVFGCTSPSSNTGSSSTGITPTNIPLPPDVQQASDLFTKQKSFDPWQLGTTDPNRTIDPYLPDSGVGNIYGTNGFLKTAFIDGQYKGGVIIHKDQPGAPPRKSASGNYSQSLDMQTGTLTCRYNVTKNMYVSGVGRLTWPTFWQKYDIAITGDPEAQQVTHANMFYLAGSAVGNQSIPPMGLSSTQYEGHIFWDAEIWMMPALVVQHPDLAYGIVDYRFKRLAAAEALAKSHGFKGAEFPWESADTGKEEAPAEFAQERHITADIAFAAWQYYLWTADKEYLQTEGWPVIKDCADYWVSRVTKTPDGKYHIDKVIGPDETSGVIDDDAYTNAIVSVTLKQAAQAAQAVGQSADPKWAQVANGLVLPKDPSNAFYIEYPAITGRLMAKQADTQMLIYPLRIAMTSGSAANTLDYAIAHTETHGPAMTDSINAIDAARLGRAQQSLDLFHDSYRPFERGPWDAFAEKRTTNGVYFCTGMGGCLQTVLYGFAGLTLVPTGQTGHGTLVAKGSNVSLYVQPHLPPGWTGLLIKGVQFQGHSYDVDIKSGNVVTATKTG